MAKLLFSTFASRTATTGMDRQIVTQAVFVDPAVADYASLLDGVSPDTEIYLLDPFENGLKQIAEALSGQNGLASISVIAHGSEGAIRLGATTVNAIAVSGSQDALARIGASLAPGGSIQLYGCDTGGGSNGQALVDQIAAATGAHVAAASHPVGGLTPGDSWTLDVTSTGAPLAAAEVFSKASEGAFAQPLASNGPPAGLPINIGTFTGISSFAAAGNTLINSNGYLQLTDAVNNQHGIAVYKQSFPSTTGISVQFTYYSGGGDGADGISFFLLDADAITAAGGSASTVQAGGYGGGLGYSNDGQAGITNGFLGIGFDTYGNFSATDRGIQTGIGQIPNEIGVRGAGNGTSGYKLLSTNKFAAGIDGTRTVKINLLKIDSGHESLSVFVSTDGGRTYNQVINNLSVAQTLPNNFYLGFAASTGGHRDLHAIENVSVTLPVNLSVSTPVITYPNSAQAGTYTLLPGDRFSYTYTITDTGPNGSNQITLLDAPSSVETNVTWTVKDDAQTQTGTGAINLNNINLSSGDSATVTVTGTISATAPSGNASHTLTSTPGTAFSFQTPSTGVVAMAIGSGNPQLFGIVPTGLTSGTTPIAPFYAAQVADAHGTPTMSATLTLTNSAGRVTADNGILSGTGLTATATPGVYTLSASSLASFNADLDSLLFTPTSAASPVDTTISLSVSDGISGTIPATASIVITATCFLSGTHILTPDGEITVEALFERRRTGAIDLVAVQEAGDVVFRPIRWIGTRHIDSAAVAESEEYPIRIRRDAVAQGIPHRDLLVTAEHCILVENRLVPARMLINGGSIVEDRSIGSYSYFHIELDRHGILISEGLTTESYLDTGNRSHFSNNDVVMLRPRSSAGEKSGEPSGTAENGLPVETARAVVEPIWQRLARRSAALGLAMPARTAPTQHDPRIALRLDDGSTVSARWQDGGRHFFPLPAGRRAVALESLSSSPARAIGPFVDDRRRLGVQVSGLILWQGLEGEAVAAAALDGDGWHALEQDRRWTDGAASLALGEARHETCFLEVSVVGTLPYPATTGRPEIADLPDAA